MRRQAKAIAWLLMVVIVVQWGPVLDACTILGIGKKAMADGTTVITHNDDSSVADYPAAHRAAADWPDGAKRKIVANAHTREGGNVLGEMPQVKHTYRYFMSRYSFMNEKGVAIAESTFSIDTSTDYGKKVKDVMWTKGDGIADCWLLQDVALERAATAREAVQIMGKLVEEFGFLTETGGGGETMTITDGTETWVAEFYGKDIWAAAARPRRPRLRGGQPRAHRRDQPRRQGQLHGRAEDRVVRGGAGLVRSEGRQAVPGQQDLRARRADHLVAPRVARVRSHRAVAQAAGHAGELPVLGEARQAAHRSRTSGRSRPTTTRARRTT